MRLLFDGEYEISWNHVWNLLGLPFKQDFIAIFHSFLNLDAQSLNIIYNLSSLAVRAVLGSDLSSSTTSIASSLHLHLHSETDLNLLHDDTLTIALGALLSFTILGPGSSAFRTVNVPCNGHVPACTKVHLFKSYMNISSGAGSFLTIITTSA